VNVASDSLPGGAERWAWLSWPAIIILVALSWRLGAVPGAPAPSARAPGAPASGGPTDSAPPPGAPPGPTSQPFGAPSGSTWAPGDATGYRTDPAPDPASGAGPWYDPGPAPGPFSWHPPADGPAAWPAAADGPAAWPAPAVRPRTPRTSRPWRWLAVPLAGTITGLLVSQFHLVGVHPPFLAGALIVVIAVVLCLAELITPRRIPRGTAAGLTYTILAGMAVWRWDSSRADLWFVAESGVILGLGVFLATRVPDARAFRRVLPGVVLTLLGWFAMGVLFAIYQNEETVVANAAFFAGLATVVAGAIATALQTVAGPGRSRTRS
jgi:hypothetical protein